MAREASVIVQVAIAIAIPLAAFVILAGIGIASLPHRRPRQPRSPVLPFPPPLGDGVPTPKPPADVPNLRLLAWNDDRPVARTEIPMSSDPIETRTVTELEIQTLSELAEIPPLWVEASGYLVNLDQVTHVEPHDDGAILHFANGRILSISADDRARVTALLFQADPDTETEP